VLELCKGKIKVNIEIKGVQERIMELVLALVKKFDMFNEVYISSSKGVHFDDLKIA